MISAEQISFAIGDFRLQVASLEVPRGEYFVLLGPPGSGKSVFLECLSGLKRIKSGRVHIDGRDVTHLEPRERGIGYVPQDYALFLHLSVERNIDFGLRVRGAGREEASRRAAEVAEMLGIQHLLRRCTQGLSGGERQRVALARALAVSPKVLLLDEPVSALDESTRDSVCVELRRVQHALGVTTIHVSHNIEEAFSVADRGGILVEGSFHQIGPVSELLRKPRSEFVARFMRCENLLVGEALGQERESTSVRVGEIRFDVPGRHEGEVKFVIRPEDIRLVDAEVHTGPDVTRLPVKLIRTVDRGAYVRVELAGAVSLVAHLSYAAFTELRIAIGTELVAAVHQEVIHVLSE